MRELVETKYQTSIRETVISVPAEFDQLQRNFTETAATKAGKRYPIDVISDRYLGMEVRRMISEPTAAALSYGLHKKKNVEYIVVVDLGGGTLDVSVLWLNSGVFITQAMAGNNRLGGQDFNNRVQRMLIKVALTPNNAGIHS